MKINPYMAAIGGFLLGRWMSDNGGSQAPVTVSDLPANTTEAATVNSGLSVDTGMGGVAMDIRPFERNKRRNAQLRTG